MKSRCTVCLRTASLTAVLFAFPLSNCLADSGKVESTPAPRPTPTSTLEQPIDLADNPARFIVAYPGDQSVTDSDLRVTQVRNKLRQIAQASGESEDLIAARCVKLARYIFDILRVQATPSEVLEALALHVRTGNSLSDMSNKYFQARRLAPNKTHAEAMTALATAK